MEAKIVRCFNCREERPVEHKRREFYRLGIPWLSDLLKIEDSYACTSCQRVVTWQENIINDDGRFKDLFLGSPRELKDERSVRYASFSSRGTSENSRISLNYHSVPSIRDDSLLPSFEGTIQDGGVIDQYGDPDLMADYAREYLQQFWVLMPVGRLPKSVTELMPSLLLLYTASELALKAFWIRSNRTPRKEAHSLVGLYQDLDPAHISEIEARFARTEVCLQLSNQGNNVPKIEDILHNYSRTYGGESNVHQDARYYAESTTATFKRQSDSWSNLHGANLVKGSTPYPIFLPDLVRTLIETYWWFSGPQRIVRLGGDLQENFRSQSKDNFGKYGLIPSSLGVVVLAVSQEHGIGMADREVEAFSDFKRLYSTNFVVDWMYGGNSYLFYHDEGQSFADGGANLGGLECRIYSQQRIALKSRDLYLLADALENKSQGSDQFGSLSGLLSTT